MKKTIFYDVTEIVRLDRKTGIQRVTKKIFESLQRRPPSGWRMCPVFGETQTGRFYCVEDFLHSNFVNFDQEVFPKADDVYLCVDLNYQLSTALAEKINSYKEQGVPIIFVVYDIFPVQYPEWYNGQDQWFDGEDFVELFSKWLRNITTISSGLVCISRTTKENLVKWAIQADGQPRNLPAIEYYYNASDLIEQNRHKLKTSLTSFLNNIRDKKTFLMVGTIEPRKGHKLAVDAFSRLWKQNTDVNLVIVGKLGWNMQAVYEQMITHVEYEKKLWVLSGIDDTFLSALYESSTALLALSMDEGFGLPLIEAASFGLPIVARNTPIFYEVCGNSAYYYSGQTSDELCKCLKDWLELYSRRAHPKSTGITVLDWNKSAAMLLSCISSISGIKFEHCEG